MRRTTAPAEVIEAIQDSIRKPNPIEEARLYTRLLKHIKRNSQRELARQMGVSQARVSQRLALLKMPRPIVKLLARHDGAFTERHARVIRRLPDPKLQIWLAARVAKDRLTVDATEDIIQDMLVELGVKGSPRSPWSLAQGLRWRRRPGWLELQVHGATHAEQLKALKLFIAIFRKEPRDV